MIWRSGRWSWVGPRNGLVIIDQDQGCSGATATGRKGFEYLIAEVGLGQAGAVFSLEASRLAG